ncbi:hypothetical protein POSPLADRAFT_1144317 [Postia placenta MAD-698-R-SB12]|uniref:Protein kinase domain-containing protein n=1 Tax=Postia placenta MAD-698-R-SB12 TaxID=670580 RepID=A0A1X6MZE6_9APHY|nr:hypothetical protein POSPLADRAFT_1144317 [Postia placenta MAD-698-R-SB12]OSX61727.1 hypothetical protein POSPLADRAFT_1144317 [Postia placenta MAD-698-R-SB12]
MCNDQPRLPSIAYVSLEESQRYAEATVKGSFGLSPAEKFWRDHQPHLQSREYVLRARYRPNWRPSWLGTNLDPTYCEDSIMVSKHNVIDAIRQRDGLLVAIKATRNDTEEIAISTFLSSLKLMSDHRNHCIPLLEVMLDPLDPEMSLMVTPYMRPFNDPEFGASGEVVDFVRQSLEGLWFLHEQRVAHRDCAAMNIMMDGRPLYPHGHHPVRYGYSRDGASELAPLARIDHPVRYYFIDFGLSTHFAPGVSPSVVGAAGRDKEVPELSLDVPYDAFKVDIFAMGNLYDKELVQKYQGLEFLQPLIDVMKQRDPERRPSAEQAFRSFEGIRSTLSNASLRWRLRPRTESMSERVLYDTVAVAREGVHHLKRLVVA